MTTVAYRSKEAVLLTVGSLSIDPVVAAVVRDFKDLVHEAKEWEGKPDKLQYFSPNPGTGD